MTSNSALGTQYSTAPNGEQFPLPSPQDEAAEIQRLQSLVAEHCAQGHEIVVVLGEKIQSHCLVLIETTVPPGTTEYVAYPILKKAFERRFPNQTLELEAVNSKLKTKNSKLSPEPLLAHSYERVMPGREYVASIRDFWRVCSGINFFSSFPARGSAATACPRTAAWASGPTRH